MYTIKLKDYGARGRAIAWVSRLPEKEYLPRPGNHEPTWELKPGYYYVHSPLSETEYTRYGLHVRTDGATKTMTRTEILKLADRASAKGV